MSRPRIFYFTPYHPEGLGRAYNEHCSLVPGDDDWIVIMDSDIMFFSSQKLGDQLETAIQEFPEYDVFTCVTNRMCGEQQIRDKNIRQERDLVRLKVEADARYKKYGGKIQPVRGFFAGYFMAFRKKLWNEIPFPEVGSQGGVILGIDSAWSHKLHLEGKKIGLMLGLMAVHFYRLDKGEGDLSHLGDPGHDPLKRHVWSGPAAPSTEPEKPRIQMLAINPHLHPPSGFYFMDDEGLRHEATSLPKLVRNIKEHRERLNKPVGDPLKEVTAQICRRHPQVAMYV